MDDAEEDFSHSVEFAEQYLRSQGELDLQMRLGKMTEKKSLSQSNEKVSTAKKTAGKNSQSITAQKLGLSVGELQLVTRLQEYRKRHSSEVL